jgi:NAD(P)-dependent dehydrogenase (short-subunit alcohol dehydrogenase family)
MRLRGKVAIVTGAGAGIGEATAVLFAREGARVCCNSLTDSAASVAGRIRAQGGEALFVRGDVSVEDEARKVIEETARCFGAVDILFNCAGIVVGGTVESSPVEEFDRCMAVNVRGVYLCSKYAIPHLRKSRGAIVNCSSVVAHKGVPNRAVYSASKGAVLSLTKAMAIDHIGDGIRVNAVCPGTIDTPSLAVRLSRMDDPQEARRQFIARQPLGRLGTPEEIAEGVLLLACNEFCTGTILTMDGGMSI